MKAKMRGILLILLLFLTIAGDVCAQEESLTLGILATRPKAEVATRWQPLADYLTHTLPGKKLHILALDFVELEDKLKRHELDFVLTNPGHYIELRQKNALSGALATLKESADQQALDAFGGVIFTLAQREDINRLTDIQGKTVAIAGTSSLGGYQAEAYQLAQAGIVVANDNRLMVTGLPYDTVVSAVLEKKADVGFVQTGILEKLAKADQLNLNTIKILNRQDLPSFPFLLSTRLYPEWPFVAMPHVKEELARHITAQLLLIDHEGLIAKAGGYHGFTIPADYSSVEELLRTLRLPPFDVVPTFTWKDILLRYRYPIAILIMACVVISLLALLLLMKNRQLLQARNHAREEENKLATILDNLGAFVYIKDTHYRYLFANQAVCQLFAMPLVEVIGCEDKRFFDHATARQLRANDRKVIEHGERLESVETNTLATTGEQRSFLSIKLPLLDSDGNIYALCGISTDITDRKRIEDLLYESNQHFERLVEISPIGVFETDAKGACIFVNSRWSDITGTCPCAAAGDGWAKNLHPDDRDLVWHEWHSAVQENRQFSLEYRYLKPDGAESWVLGQAVALPDASGGIIGYIGAITDITTAKQAALDLQRSNAELEQFAYAISHDMRQPLRMVTSYLSLIERSLSTQLDEETRQFLAFASDGAKRMDQMILSLLEFSRIGRKTVPMARISSRDALDEALAFLKPEITANAATLVEVSGEWPELTASYDELSRLLQNLIDNALKYHPEDKAPRVSIQATVINSTFRVEIRDEGIGIEPEQTERLFKVFSRLQSRSRFEGTGVGLALCRKIVEHHGGRIGVESLGENRGSCFWFEMPGILTGLPEQN